MLMFICKGSVFLYVVSSLFYFSALWSRRKSLSKVGTFVLGTGFVLHTVGIVWRSVEISGLPITSLHGALSFFSWCIIAVFIIVQGKHHVGGMGIVVAPISAILSVIATACESPDLPVKHEIGGYWLIVHGILSFAGEAVLALAFAAGLLYLIQESRIKKKVGSFGRGLPSLEALDELNYRCLGLGFPLLTGGIITGSIWASDLWGSYWSWDPKETWSLVTWLIYAALLHQRLNVGWRGKRAAIMAILGFLFVIVTFIGVNLVLPGLHSFRSFLG